MAVVCAIPYEIDGQKFEGALVAPRRRRKHPGLIMAPNWFGVTADAVRRAGIFSELGYVVLVPDLYGAGHRPTNMDEAAALANPLRADALKVRGRMLRALDVLESEGAKRKLLAPEGRGALGFCFGGGNALELARSGAPIQAAISIHGDLETALPATSNDIKAAILVLHGEADPVAPKQHRDSFEAEMNGAAAAWQMVVFGGVLHAYTDEGVDAPPIARYDAYAAKQTYLLAHGFLRNAFAGDI